MTCMIFTVFEGPSGWFVEGHGTLGPFFCRQRAMDLAEGMVSALRAVGEAAEMRVTAHPDPAPLTRERPNFADKWRNPGPGGGLAGANPSHRTDETEAERVRAERDRADEARRHAVS